MIDQKDTGTVHMHVGVAESDRGKLTELLGDHIAKLKKLPRKPTVYLANDLGFSTQMRENFLPKFVAAIHQAGCDVLEPFHRNNNMHKPDNEKWELECAKGDLADVRNADAVFAIVNGMTIDDGVAVEIGIAIGMGKPVFLYRDDHRQWESEQGFPFNFMLLLGCPNLEKGAWRDYMYSSIREITWEHKPLCQWVNSWYNSGDRHNSTEATK